MLIKEYRIPLPLTVEEYRIAQLYMIAKKSRDESQGQGSGVEIIINEPYQEGPGGNGQYTKKIYHVGSHLPGWIKSLLPKSALTVEEEAWNAYPFTKTRYTCPFVEKFSLDIETYYYPDNGFQENVFKLSGSDLRNRVVDLIDIVKDQLYGGDYVKEEDPAEYISEKTLRGPLDENWLDYYWNEVKGKQQPTSKNMSLMCAYKLCRVEFRYWGMQTKLEKFIHDVALRKTMVRAHRQAWAWQDEWFGLTMDDIREFERQTQLALAKTMGLDSSDDEEDGGISQTEHTISAVKNENEYQSPPLVEHEIPIIKSSSDDEVDDDKARERSNSIQITKAQSGSKGALHSPAGSSHSFDVQVVNWRMGRLEMDANTVSEEEFFDCLDTNESNSLAKWSSLELFGEEEDSPPPHSNTQQDDSIFSHDYLQRIVSERGSKRQIQHSASIDKAQGTPKRSLSCQTSILVLVMHGGNVLDTSNEILSKKSDVNTFRTSWQNVMQQHYPSLLTQVTIKLVPCPSICTDALGILSSLSPYSFDTSLSVSDIPNTVDVPIGAIPLLTTTSPAFQEHLNNAINTANSVYQEFLKSEEGTGFNGQVVLIGDSMGSILAYEGLCRTKPSKSYEDERLLEVDSEFKKLSIVPPSRRRSSSCGDSRLIKFEFDVGDLFMFGTSLSIVLASRRLSDEKQAPIRPNCVQVYNLFHPTDPTASRLEPLLSARFSDLPPVNVPRYTKYPLGNGLPLHILEIIQTHPQYFSEHHNERRLSDVSIQSTTSGLTETISLHTVQSLQRKWWGTKRLDYALYCPEGLSNFPAHALPHLFHASYWESFDVIAFILRQIGNFENLQMSASDDNANSTFRPGQPREKWIKKRTSVKIKNVAANHRANDVIVLEGMNQKLAARFMYGPLDMFTLAGEKVDIHIMNDPPSGEWILIGTEITDKTGRVIYNIPAEKAPGYGIYPIKMVVRGDHTSVDFYMAVIPHKTECVVFSIDGSFTASMSVTGRDPKVRAGAVDICRHWQELGYLLIYITGRPDLQQQRVVSWLSQHNFPHGLISFADGLSTDPLGHKTAFLNDLIENHGVSIHAAYGSSKDIAVYTNIGLNSNQIYIVGKVSKKLQSNATVLTEGYVSHLNSLLTVGGSRPAQGNARMVIPRVCFNLPGQISHFRKKSSSINKESLSQSHTRSTSTTSTLFVRSPK